MHMGSRQCGPARKRKLKGNGNVRLGLEELSSSSSQTESSSSSQYSAPPWNLTATTLATDFFLQSIHPFHRIKQRRLRLCSSFSAPLCLYRSRSDKPTQRRRLFFFYSISLQTIL
ncbi:unnamed protein product [Vicia faba]|uniref:Uncharacterized protein n=1 Tax=Vicia faba TaxID=3906 RepID=A0AAV0ZY19_VICFA|nr:unnamed protein product [Vicia faba]